MKNAALSGCLGAGFLLAATVGCEPVDDGAVSRTRGCSCTLSDHLLPGDRGVFIDIDETQTVANGCAKTEIDALKILKQSCASCHSGPTSVGLPPFDFVLDPAKMKMMTWQREGQPALPFLKPGAPAESAIYLRAVLLPDKPPTADQGGVVRHSVNYSEASVLYQWIAVCM